MGAKTDTRQRMVTSAALLLRERGVAGTTVAGVLEHSHGPRGSVTFHFPGGRGQLLTDALRWVGKQVSDRLRQQLADGVPPADMFDSICTHYRAQLEATGFAAGCPIGAAAQESFADPELGPVVAEIVEDWVDLLSQALSAAGRTPDEARDQATVAISAMEGAITMARVRRSATPIDLTLELVRPLLT